MEDAVDVKRPAVEVDARGGRDARVIVPDQREQAAASAIGAQYHVAGVSGRTPPAPSVSSSVTIC